MATGVTMMKYPPDHTWGSWTLSSATVAVEAESAALSNRWLSCKSALKDLTGAKSPADAASGLLKGVFGGKRNNNS